MYFESSLVSSVNLSECQDTLRHAQIFNLNETFDELFSISPIGIKKMCADAGKTTLKRVKIQLQSKRVKIQLQSKRVKIQLHSKRVKIQLHSKRVKIKTNLKTSEKQKYTQNECKQLGGSDGLLLLYPCYPAESRNINQGFRLNYTRNE